MIEITDTLLPYHNNEICAVAYWLVHRISVSGERLQ